MTPALLVVHAILLARPVGGACESAGTPPSAVVGGRVITKSRTALPGVQVEATIAGNGRSVTTVSDVDGRYVLSELDVGADVELTYRDPTGRIMAGCWITTPRDGAWSSVDVVLDDFRPAEVSPAAGCQGVSPNDSWVTAGDRRRIVVGDRDVLHPTPFTMEPVPRLELRAADIEAAQPGLDDDTVVVRLGPAARRALAEFTEANIGRVVVIAVDGLVASARITVRGAITSGVMTIGRSALRGRLCEILRDAPQSSPAPSNGR